MSITPPPSPKYELILDGLAESVNSTSIIDYFSALGVSIRNIELHPNYQGSQCAQLSVSTEENLARCLDARPSLAEQNITVHSASRPLKHKPPVPVPPFFYLPPPPPPRFTVPPTPTSLPRARILAQPPQGHGRPFDVAEPLRQNLYILNVPPFDSYGSDFPFMFMRYGTVLHWQSMFVKDTHGYDRGFVVMSTHSEARRVMNAMSGQCERGHRLDVSWAHNQKEPNDPSFAQKGYLPPGKTRKQLPPDDCCAMVDNLDPTLFHSAARIRETFQSFGRIVVVRVISGPPIKVLLFFDNPTSAEALINSDGFEVCGRPLIVERYVSPPSEPTTDHYHRCSREYHKIEGNYYQSSFTPYQSHFPPAPLFQYQQPTPQASNYAFSRPASTPANPFKFDPFQNNNTQQPFQPQDAIMRPRQPPSSLALNHDLQGSTDSDPFIPLGRLRNTSSNSTAESSGIGIYDQRTDEHHSTGSMRTSADRVDASFGFPGQFDALPSTSTLVGTSNIEKNQMFNTVMNGIGTSRWSRAFAI